MVFYNYAIEQPCTLTSRRTSTQTSRLLAVLSRQDWIDIRSRVVFVEFSLFNANANLFASVVLAVEFMASGSAVTWSDVKVFRLSSLVGPIAALVLLAQFIFLAFTIYFFIKFCRNFKKEKKNYFKVN